ncbi:MAG: hypothetical protein ACK2U1_20060 [Anaerolineales bacterium]
MAIRAVHQAALRPAVHKAVGRYRLVAALGDNRVKTGLACS